ncbi:MAG: GWxTD domain-containing protein [Gemmatimonadales bacterium]
MSGLLTALSLPLWLATGAWAQTPHDRDLDRFRDSLAAAPDNDALKALERTLILRVAKDRSNAGLHARLGLIALRFGAYSDAAAEFKAATRAAPNWAEAWLGLGRSELALGEVADTSRLGRRALLAQSAWERAATSFARAAADPGAAARLVDLAADRVRAGRPDAASILRDGLRRTVTSSARTGSAFLALGRVEALLGDSSAAVIAFEAGAAVPGGGSLALLEAARLRLARSDDRGIPLYYEALDTADSLTVAEFRRDLAWIASGQELAEFDAADPAGRLAVVRHFWTRRDRNDLRADGERLLEHYRRIAIASGRFSNPDDQRVAVLIRHGEPDNRASLAAPGVPANESWRYRQGDGDRFVHFQASADTANYRVVESIFDLVADTGAPAGGDREDLAGLADQVLRSRAQLAPFYQAAVAGRREQLAAFMTRERELGRAGRNLALSSDGFPLAFARDLPARVRVASLSGDRTGGSLDILFVLPAFALDSGAGEPLVRLRAVVWEGDGGAATIDTVLAPQLEGGIRGSVSLTLPAGRYDSRVALEIGDRGTTVAAAGTVVGAGDAAIALLDLTVGARGSGPGWDLGGATLLADPGAVFQRADTLDLGAAVVAAPGETVKVRPMWRAVRPDGREEKWHHWSGSEWQPVTVDARGRGRAAVVVAARALRVGRYEVGLAVAGAAEPVAGRRREIVVTESGK